MVHPSTKSSSGGGGSGSRSEDVLSKELLQLSLNDHHSASKLLSRELLELPQEARNALEEEIHGVSTRAVDETPESLAASLEDLSRALAAIPDADPLKRAYRQGREPGQPANYADTPGFRLRFLRCERMDAPKAAVRMLRFLNLAVDFWGPSVLERPVCQADLSPEDRAVLQEGHLQYLPFRDRAGRPVWVWVGDFFFALDPAAYRISLYMHYVMSGDVENQQKGLVFVIWPKMQDYTQQLLAVPAGGTTNHHRSNPLLEMGRSRQRFYEAVPTRWSTVHWCLPDEPHYRVLHPTFAILTARPSQTRFHHGRRVELLYKLKTYGIPVESIPVTGTGTVKVKAYWKQWIRGQTEAEEQRQQEHDGTTPKIVVYPGSRDVLYRKGTSLTSHPGNNWFQGLIESKLPDHLKAYQTEKKAITDALIETVYRHGGRFLQWDKAGGWWKELTEASQIRLKVANQVKMFKFRTTYQNGNGKSGGGTTMAGSSSSSTTNSSTFLFQNQDHAKRRKLYHHHSSDTSGSEEDCDCACFF